MSLKQFNFQLHMPNYLLYLRVDKIKAIKVNIKMKGQIEPRIMRVDRQWGDFWDSYVDVVQKLIFFVSTQFTSITYFLLSTFQNYSMQTLMQARQVIWVGI